MFSSSLNLVIFGTYNRGKTTTIKNVCNKLLLKSDFIEKEMINEKDFIAILKLSNQKVVAICSIGDTGDLVDKWINIIDTKLQNLKIAKVDYYICTTRTKGESIEALNNNIQCDEFIWFNTLDLTNFRTKSSSQNIIDKYTELQTERILEFIEF